MPMMTTSDRLQTLLDRAREANKIERNRVSLETFLAGLEQEDEHFNEAPLKQIPLSIYETLLGLFDTTISVPQTTHAFAATASRAVQTDAATISLWDLLPKARKEAYARGFNAGKDDGRVQSSKEGNSTGRTEGLAIGFEWAQAEGLKTGLEQGEEAEMQRGIEIGTKSGSAGGLAEGMKQAKEEIKKLGEEDRRHMLQREAARQKMVVKLPPTLTATKKNMEEVKTQSNGIDPFASLLGLVLKK